MQRTNNNNNSIQERIEIPPQSKDKLIDPQHIADNRLEGAMPSPLEHKEVTHVGILIGIPDKGK